MFLLAPYYIFELLSKNASAEDSALLNIESIGKKVSMDLMDLERTSSYEFVGENFGRLSSFDCLFVILSYLYIIMCTTAILTASSRLKGTLLRD